VNAQCRNIEVDIGLQKRALIQSNNVANKSLNFGGDITPYGYAMSSFVSAIKAW